MFDEIKMKHSIVATSEIKIFFCLLFVSRKFCSNIQKHTFAYKGNIIESHSKFSNRQDSAFNPFVLDSPPVFINDDCQRQKCNVKNLDVF